MKINKEKTKTTLFNPSKSIDFVLEMRIDDERIETTEEIKLLGIVLTDDLKWNRNTCAISKKGYSRIWILRRLKKLAAYRGPT